MDLNLENKAAWIAEKGGWLTVGPADVTPPGPNEVLMKNHAWGINPIDWKIQSLGVMLERYPAILGFETAGEVVAVGEDVKKFNVRFITYAARGKDG